MFKCAICETKNNKRGKLLKGNTQHGVTEFRVITVVRKVKYINQIKFNKIVPQGDSSKVVTSYKNVGETLGTEVVREESYCPEHLPEHPNVKILEGITERITFVTPKRRDNQDRGEE